jgi:hypothetical protein
MPGKVTAEAVLMAEVPNDANATPLTPTTSDEQHLADRE